MSRHLRSSFTRSLRRVFLATALLPFAAPSAVVLAPWDPGSVGILSHFGTVALAPAQTTGDFVPFPGSGFYASYNGNDRFFAIYDEVVSGDPFAASLAIGVASVGEFAVKARTLNQRGVGNDSPLPIGNAPIAAGAAAATDFYIPPLGGVSPPNGEAPCCVVGASLNVAGSFQSDRAGNFAYVEVLVNQAAVLYVLIIDEAGRGVTAVARPDADGKLVEQILVGPWAGSGEFLFTLPADTDAATVGRLDLRLWTESQARSDASSGGNAANFLNTAALTFAPPPGTFVGLASGLAFLPDPSRTLSGPSSLSLLGLGIAALGWRRRSASLTPHA